MFGVTSHWENANQNHNEVLLHTNAKGQMKTSVNSRCWQGHRETGWLMHRWRGHKMAEPLGDSFAASQVN